MEESERRLALMQASTSCEGAAAANGVLVVVAAVFAGISLILAGAIGYLLGKASGQKSRRQEDDRDDKQNPPQPPPRRGSIGQESTESDGWPRLSRKDALRPITNAHIHDLDTAQEALARQGKGKEDAASTAIHAVTSHAPVVQNIRPSGMPEALAAVYSNYISQWHNNEVPWTEPFSGQDSTLGSRLASYASDRSGYLTRASSEGEAWTPLHYQPSNTSQMGAQLPFSPWEITCSQLALCYTPAGELVTLGKPDESGKIQVYKAVLDGKIEVAVKTFKIAKDAMPHDKLLELALQQLALNAAQHIVHFYGICQTDESIMLVYEYVEGGSLREAMRRDPVGLSWYNYGRAVARDAAQGLAYLHRHGMEHRSFKSNQVLVRPDKSAKVSDAGLTVIQRFCSRSLNSRLANSFEWSAPELLLGQRCGSQADVFSFGTMLWELVTQEMPIRGALREVRVPEECPGPIKCLISRCMATDPAARPTANEIVNVIQRSWNLTRDGKGGGLGEPEPSRQNKRSVLRTSRSQPLDGAKAGDLLTRPVSAVKPRSPRDSVSEMVDYRRGQPVRRGTLRSAQSMGGATSSPSRWYPTPEGALKHSAARPPISPASERPSPRTSPENARSMPPLRHSISLAMLERQRAAGLLTGAAMRPRSSSLIPETPMANNKFMSPPRSFMQGRSDQVSAERRRRARDMRTSLSAPAHTREGSREQARQAADLEAELSTALALRSAKVVKTLQAPIPQQPQQRQGSILPPPQDAGPSMLVSAISSVLSHERQSPSKGRDSQEAMPSSANYAAALDRGAPPPNPFSLARDVLAQKTAAHSLESPVGNTLSEGVSPQCSLSEMSSLNQSEDCETTFSHWLPEAAASSAPSTAVIQNNG